MDDRFDVIVVGARCAGASVAALLARRGHRVALIERARFPRDTLSSHIFQAPGINFLRRLGVLERVLDTGAPGITGVDFRQGEFHTRASFERRPGDAAGMMSVRRFVLDPLLAEAALEAGAEVMMATAVTGLVQSNGRVDGVRICDAGGERDLRARMVVGADGRNSTIARLTGARKYHVVPSERFLYWGFFEGVDVGPDPEIIFHHWDGNIVVGCPADSGLYEVNVIAENRRLPSFRADLEGSFMKSARACAPVAELLHGATRVGKLLGIVRFESFFREAAGPGWVLVGDAGQFKDPTPGQGMTDAFRQADALAGGIGRGLGGRDDELDAATADWAAWRDRDAFEHHWLACDLGAAGSQPAVLEEVARRLERCGQFGAFTDIFHHRALPSRVVTPGRLLSTAGAMLSQRGCDRRAVLREVRELVITDVARKRLRRAPVFVDPVDHADAGETEVPQEVAA